MSAPNAPALARRPYALTNLTVLLWHALPLGLLVTWVIVTAVQARAHPPAGEDWTGVVVLIALVFGSGALLASFGIGVAVSGLVLKRKIRRAVESGQIDVTRRMAIASGSIGTMLVWVTGVVLVVVIPLIVAAVNHATGTGTG